MSEGSAGGCVSPAAWGRGVEGRGEHEAGGAPPPMRGMARAGVRMWEEALAKFGTATASKKRVARVEALPVVAVLVVEPPPSHPGSSGLVCYLFVSL